MTDNSTILKQLLNEATGPPWDSRGVVFNGDDGMIGEVGFGMRDDDEMVACARLIVALRNAAPALMAVVDAAWHANRELPALQKQALGREGTTSQQLRDALDAFDNTTLEPPHA